MEWLVVTSLVAALWCGVRVLEEETAAEAPRPSPRAVEIRCPYCKEDLAGTGQACRDCATVHHPGCWEEHGGCAVFACRAGEGARARRQARLPEPQPAAPEPEPKPREDSGPLPAEGVAGEGLEPDPRVASGAGG